MMKNFSHPLLGCNGEIKNSRSYFQAIIMTIVIAIMIMTSIFGNLLVIIAIHKFQKLRTLTNALLCSLAVTDLVTPTVRLLSISIAFIKQKWIFGCQWCQISSVIGVFLCSVSILHLCVISLERFVTINHPMKRHRYITKKLFIVVIIFIWTTSLAMSLLPYTKLVKMAFLPELFDCTIDMLEKPYLSILLTLTYFVLPLLLMVIVYYKVYQTVKTQTKQICADSVGTVEEKLKLKVRKEWKAVKTVLVVIGLFFLLWIPYFIVSSISSYHPQSVPSWIKRFVFLLGYLNSCCNWIVYSVRNKQLRQAFMRLLHLRENNMRGRGLSDVSNTVSNIGNIFEISQRYNKQTKLRLSISKK